MIGKEGPGQTIDLGIQNQFAQPLFEKPIVFVVEEDFPSFNPPGHYMREHLRCIQTRLSRHKLHLSYPIKKEYHNFMNVPVPQISFFYCQVNRLNTVMMIKRTVFGANGSVEWKKDKERLGLKREEGGNLLPILKERRSERK